MPQNQFKDDDQDFLEKLSPEKKKLYWRSIRRGMKEADLIFGLFARSYLADMNDEELRAYSDILHCFDQDLLNWITGKENVPDDLNTPLFHKIKSFSPFQFIV
ncbi:MAG: succinate dehydrogenase assembly factor 2 [Pseudomonadota bacterium]